MGNRAISEAGLQLIKQFEGLKLDAYQDSGGIWTIGYGQTGPEIVKGTKWTQKQADEALAKSLSTMCLAVSTMAPVPLTENQFAALVAFTFNVGPGRFRNSTLLKKLLAKDYAGAKAEFGKWDKVMGQPLPGLTRRRRAEADLFGAPDA